MSLHPTIRQDLGYLAGRRISLTPAMPVLRRKSQIIIDLSVGEYAEVPPAHIAADALRKGRDHG